MTLKQFLDQIKNSPVELMGVIFHDRNGIADFRIVGEGTADRCRFSFKPIAEGINATKSAMLPLVHNHPTGEVRPSREDLQMTFDLQDRLKEGGVKIHDHLILGGNGGVYSFAENGVI